VFDLKTYLEQSRAHIDAALTRYLEAPHPRPRIVAAMAHSLMAGGKRLRPILCRASAEAVGQAPSAPLMAAACALEMVHTYSLIHDDLPAMDDDRTRRGQPTCHVAFDEATAILAGDGLLTLAFEVLSRPEALVGIDPETWRQVICQLALAAGHHGMIEGQMRDMAAEKHPLDRKGLEAMHRLKTGALIRAAAGMGARLAGASADALGRLDRYAAALGLAFQVADDILNVTGDPERMGKAVGTDADHGKSTYPALLGLEASRRMARQMVDEALQAIETFDNRASPLRAIARYSIDRSR
jgi:geranylgeranyl diphosphate synthase type II